MAREFGHRFDQDAEPVCWQKQKYDQDHAHPQHGSEHIKRGELALLRRLAPGPGLRPGMTSSWTRLPGYLSLTPIPLPTGRKLPMMTGEQSRSLIA